MITYHHIGARSGSYSLPLKEGPLLQDFHIVFYDADPSCLEQVPHKANPHFGKMSILGKCIAKETKTLPFQHNFHPSTNSLYPFCEEYNKCNYIHQHYGEFCYEEATSLVKKQEIACFSLPDALQESSLEGFDFLSLDVQGAELDVLQGATSLLQEKCLGLHVEINFAPIYSAQGTFDHVHTFLSSLGFELIRLESLERCAYTSLPAGFRAHELPLFGEATYIKKCHFLNQKEDLESLFKITFFHLLYGNMGYAASLIEQYPKILTSSSFPHCTLLLQQFAHLLQSHEDLYFPKLKEFITPEMIRVLYQDKTLSHFNTLKNAKLALVKKEMQLRLKNIRDLLLSEKTPFEQLLEEHRLYELAEVVKKNRQKEWSHFAPLFDAP